MSINLAEINRLDHDGFIGQLGDVFEHSPWVAEQARPQAPFGSIEALHEAMMAAVEAAPREKKIAFLNAHPELAGAEARAKSLTADSTAEQKGAGLSSMSDADFDTFARLNKAYREKFGFPYIIAVRGRGKDEILADFKARLENDAEAEEREAFQQIGFITRMRLDRLIEG